MTRGVEMRAVRLHEDGLRLEELPRPEPGAGDVLVRVHAAAITRDELTWHTDRLPTIPSFELSGETEGGDEVFALTPFEREGVLAELAVVPAAVLAPKPASLSHVEAAALPMGALTAWQGLVVHGRLQAGERVVVTGAKGGVGHLAVQIARSLGAEVVPEGEPCDLLFDTAGRPNGPAARKVSVAEEAPGVEYFIVERDGEQLAEVAALGLRPEVDSTFPFADFERAFARLEQHGKRGKVVIDVAGG
jgi:NADPH:quinone reductase-like Zn-dependent oxidoreductase